MKKNVLLILGHSNEDSFCSSVSDIYLEKLSNLKNINLKFISLAKIKFDPILHKGYREIQELEPDLKSAQKDILWANHIIFIYPIWWMNMPAILKGFCDRIFLPGFAFRYIKGIPFGLLKDKTAEIIVSCGGPKIFYKFFSGKIAIKVLKNNILKFCGIKTKKITIYSGILKGDYKNKLEKIKKTKIKI
jgi:putative NADPH-quinone reductase